MFEPGNPSRFQSRIAPGLRPLARYHRFELRGGEHLPEAGPALIVGTHSAITYDFFLAVAAVVASTGRVPRTMGDRFWFQTRWVGDWMRDFGTVEADREVSEALLDAGELVAVAPGGMREAMLPTAGRRPDWAGRYGFVRLWLKTRVPLIFATCPAAERVITVYRNPLTAIAYRRFKQPLPLWRGLGPTLLPRPERLVFHLSPPLAEEPNGPVTEERVQAVHARLTAEMKAFMKRVT